VLGEANVDDLGIVTLDAIEAAGGSVEPMLLLADLAGDDPAAVARELEREYSQEMTTDVIPTRIASLHRVRELPLTGLLFAAAMVVVVLLYSLAASVRVRARDVATLRALGLAPRRLAHVFASHGIALATVMVLVGVPLGLVGGVAFWRRFAHRLGVDDAVAVAQAIGLISAVLAATFLVATLAAIMPTRRARRLPVATLLRSE